MKDDRVYLRHIRDAITRIESTSAVAANRFSLTT